VLQADKCGRRSHQHLLHVPTCADCHSLDQGRIVIWRTRAVHAPEPAKVMTAEFVVTWRGWLAAERYGEGSTARTPLEGWSMGKSLTATLLGILSSGGDLTRQPFVIYPPTR
jgi:hypothetical protein